jgi:hypothetical protein
MTLARADGKLIWVLACAATSVIVIDIFNVLVRRRSATEAHSAGKINSLWMRVLLLSESVP